MPFCKSPMKWHFLQPHISLTWKTLLQGHFQILFVCTAACKNSTSMAPGQSCRHHRSELAARVAALLQIRRMCAEHAKKTVRSKMFQKRRSQHLLITYYPYRGWFSHFCANTTYLPSVQNRLKSVVSESVHMSSIEYGAECQTSARPIIL